MDTISIFNIRIDGGTQARIGTYPDVVKEYADAYMQGAELPPLVVFWDGENNWLADGFHRLEARRLAEYDDAPCDIRQGTKRDAILFAVAANSTHGLRRTNGDKRRAVQMLLEDKEWRTWSDHKIADFCAVSQPFVSKLREELFPAKMAADNRYRAKSPSGKVDRDSREYAPNIPKPPMQKGLFQLCERCQRVGQVAGCASCASLEGKAMSTPKESAAKPASQVNEEIWNEIEASIAKTVEGMVNVCMTYPGEDKSTDNARLAQLLGEASQLVQGWRNRLE